jgi:hypothetical protein
VQVYSFTTTAYSSECYGDGGCCSISLHLWSSVHNVIHSDNTLRSNKEQISISLTASGNISDYCQSRHVFASYRNTAVAEWVFYNASACRLCYNSTPVYLRLFT